MKKIDLKTKKVVSPASKKKIPMNDVRNEFPREILDQLDPQLARLVIELPDAIYSDIAKLIRQLDVGPAIRPDRLLIFAIICDAAQRMLAGYACSEEHESGARHELVGKLHGLENGYSDQDGAGKVYRRGRLACQRLRSSIKGRGSHFLKVERVMQKYQNDLSLPLQDFLRSEMDIIREHFQAMERALRLGNDFLVPRGAIRTPTVLAQTVIWWDHFIPAYKGKSEDMSRLATAWRLTTTSDVVAFRVVAKAILTQKRHIRPIGDPWRALLAKQRIKLGSHPFSKEHSGS